MALDNFRTQKIIWDRANKKIFETIEANSGDSNGRKLVVQVINQETTENLSGTTLSLGWKSRNGAKGLDAFNVVDASKGIFEIYYTTEMLSNIGNLEASLILIDSTGRIESSTFTISVRPSTVDDESIESENSFTALTEALVKVNDFDEQLAQKADDYVVRKRTEPITLNDLDESALNAIAGGENTNFTIEGVPRDFSVGPDKTTFARKGINEFDGIYKRYILRSDGTFGESDIARSAIIRITGGKTYHFRKNGGDRRRLGFHKSEPTSTEDPLDDYVGEVTPGKGYVAPEGANYAVYCVSNSSETPDLQITEGKDYPFFVGYNVNINLENKSQTLDLLEEGDRIRDVLNSQRAYLYSTDIQIKIDYRNKTVVIPEATRTFYGGKRNIISNEGETLSFESFTQSFVIYFNTENNEVGLTDISISGKIPDNIAVIGTINPFRPIFNGLDEHLIEVNGEMFIPEQTKTYVKNELENTELNYNKYYFLDSIDGIYEKPEGLESVASGEPLELRGSQYENIYNIFDQLVNGYDFVSKEVIGHDTSGNPMNGYTFKLLEIENESNYQQKKLKFIITSAIHGYEQMSAWATAQFFKHLCENPESQSALEFMNWNVEFVVVPVVNPWGYSNNSRENFNGVDLNRNFPPKGNGNEIETQVMIDFIDHHSDAQFFIDFHNISGGYPMTYSATEEATNVMTNLWRSMTRKWRKDYPNAPQDVPFGYIKQNGMRGRLNNYGFQTHGILPYTLETPWRMPFASDEYDKVTTEIAVDSLGNLLTILCKSVS